MTINRISTLVKAGVFAGSLVLMVALMWACGFDRRPEAGAVVVHLKQGQGCDRAGIEPGDTIVHWRRGVLEGPINSPFDLALVEQREAPAGPVELTVRRGRREVKTMVQTGYWQVESRPVFPSGVFSQFRQAEERAEDAQIEAAVEAFESIARHCAENGKEAASRWLNLKAALVLFGNDHPQKAQDQLDRAAQAISDHLDRAVFLEYAASALLEAGRLRSAAKVVDSALDLHRGLGTEGPVLAHLLLQRCRSDLRSCGPEAWTALSIYRKTRAESMEVALALRVTGGVEYFRSEWDAASEDYRRGLGMVRKLAPDCPLVCDFLGNLGLVSLKQGDFDTARRLFREDFAEAERLGSPPEQMGYAANFLGLVAKKTGQLQEARMSYLRALEVFRDYRPGGIEEAGILTNLGNVAIREGDFRSAKNFHRQALEIRERLEPDGSDTAASLNNLGSTLRLLGLYDDARLNLEKALDIKQRLTPQSGWAANSMTELGEVARLQGRYEDAIELHREASKIRTQVAPGDPQIAGDLYFLGRAYLESGRSADAEKLWTQAIDIIEACRSGMGFSDEEQAKFGGTFFQVYRAMAGLLVDQGRGVEAFNLIEQARTGELSALLMDRIRPPPGVTGDLWFEKNRNEGRIQRIENRRVRISLLEHSEQLKQLNETLLSLREQQAVLLEKIGVASPNFKRLSLPRSIRFSEIATVLQPGTALLSYVVGENRLLLMTVTVDAGGRASLEASSLQVGFDDLSSRVDIFRALINRGRSGGQMERALRSQAERLFQLLIEPCREVVEAADRVLILSDGPLLSLPFAALIDQHNDRYLGQWKSLVFNPSAGIVVALNGTRPPVPTGSGRKIVAFGDPLLHSGTASAFSSSLERLPGSRSEVENLARVFGHDATVFLGGDATESALREVIAGATYVHLAVHALVDKMAPLDSALFLSPGNGGWDDAHDDGILSAFEVMNELATNADVVTLSACGTAGGREVPGEGIVGLARAFQYAGARSVVVTQWPVADQSTAALMKQFYAGLKLGMGPAEALQRAQSGQLALGGTSGHPFNWAAFQVMGDLSETAR